MPSNRLNEHFFQRLERSGLPEKIDKGLKPPRKSGPPAVVELLGPDGADLTFVAAGLARRRKAPLLLISPRQEDSEHRYDDLYFFGFEDALHFPSWELLPFEQDRPGLEIMSKRLDALTRLSGLAARPDGSAYGPAVISASVDALLQKTVPPAWLREKSVFIEWGQEIDRAALDRKLEALGYIEEPMVEARGEFSMRGGVIDIFPLDSDYPYRLDLFGDEVESIRRFDVSTQRSLPQDKDAVIERIALPPADEREAILMAMREGVELASPLDYLPEDTVIVLDAPELQASETAKFDELVAKELDRIQHGRSPWEDQLGKGREAPVASEEYISGEELRKALLSRTVVEAPRLPMPPAPDDERARRRVEVKSRTFADAKPELESWLDSIQGRQRDDYLVAVVCDNLGQAHRLEAIFQEHEIQAIIVEKPEEFKPGSALEGYADAALMRGDLTAGFIMPEARLMFVTDREIFGRYKRRHVYRKIYKGTPIRSATEIARGDFVVHVDHGVGKYLGLRRQAIDGADVDLIEIRYKDDDKLLVPVDKVNRVQKYGAGEANPPALDKLGGKRWEKRKKKSQEQVEAMAEQLLELYAQRELAGGVPFKPDTPAQREFEAGFLYKETPDQIEAIIQSKQDMESSRPMDRLVCGDVGYGKTEVAIRAAFKAIQDGKQVALLCPTTVLATQHYNTFRERFADYPIKVEPLSRFQSKKEIAESIRRIASGEANMAVGTHRILSKDVKFADLGLVVVDEEQRFGVAHKEKLRALRASVDVMTLSATPIPRTLYMALSGIRDMSLISTPPADRYPIRTRAIRFEKDQLEEALLREINRGGQVYFIHNRVHNIEDVAARIREIVPNASLAIGHGQMGDAELEEVMAKFVDGQTDILVATTIVENGLDIPNCNTIIINRADAFGLAQLYQLRGRVGRGNRQAYAYLIVPDGQPITEAAVKRLEAIEEFTDLGMGFQVAMRDMEIRGAGNVLGGEQHGAMETIGFELYCEMLESAVKRLRGDDSPRPAEIDMSWRAPAYIPPDYMPIEAQRLDLYKRLAASRELDKIDALEEETRDRCGQLPEPVKNIFQVARLRIVASEAGATRLAMTPEGFRVDHSGDPVKSMAVWTYMEQEHPGVKEAVFSAGDAIKVTVNAWNRGSRVNKAIKLFQAYLASIDLALGGGPEPSKRERRARASAGR